MQIERFENPVIKKASEMQTGDVFRTQYGDYGNCGEYVFESCEAYGRNTKINVHCDNPNITSMYDLESIDNVTLEVVGKVL